MSNEIIRRRALRSSGAAIDWESIARGMCDYKTEFTIPNELEIDASRNNAFSGRVNLKAVHISTQRRSTGSYTFSATGITEVTFSPNITSLGNNSFTQCVNLLTITIPATITKLGTGVFYSCSKLAEVIMEATTPPTIGINLFQSCPALTSIYVPDASVEAYKAATNWSTYASKIKGISERPVGGGNS